MQEGVGGGGGGGVWVIEGNGIWSHFNLYEYTSHAMHVLFIHNCCRCCCCCCCLLLSKCSNQKYKYCPNTHPSLQMQSNWIWNIYPRLSIESNMLIDILWLFTVLQIQFQVKNVIKIWQSFVYKFFHVTMTGTKKIGKSAHLHTWTIHTISKCERLNK